MSNVCDIYDKSHDLPIILGYISCLLLIYVSVQDTDNTVIWVYSITQCKL